MEAMAAANDLEATNLPVFHDLSFPGGVWVCPITGIVVEKDREKNLRQRQRILEEAANDPEYQRQIMAACKASFLVFCNLFLVTYQVIEHSADGKRGKARLLPFITWPVQDALSDVMVRAPGISLDGEPSNPAFPVAIDKSREMGASWLVLAIMVWLFVFHGASSLVGSRSADEVDYTGRPKAHSGRLPPGNSDTLLWKVDLMLHWLPAWMKPQIDRTQRTILNLDNGAQILGETTNDDLGRGGRKAIIALDEAGAIENLRQIEQAAMDACASLWYISTPKPGTYYSEVVQSGRVQVLTMGWWDHPDKGGQGREVAYDADMGRMVITGPWRERQKQTRSPEDVALNIDIDHQAAGKMFFSPLLIRIAKASTRPPYALVRFVHEFSPGFDQDRSLTMREHRRIRPVVVDSLNAGSAVWKLWIDPTRRPPQDRIYVGAGDIGFGTGASNSVLGFAERATRTKIAELATAALSPDELVREYIKAAIWFGGDPNAAGGVPFLIWEANGGQGQTFSKTMVRMEYPWLYHRRKGRGMFQRQVEDLGWWTDRDTKEEGLLALGTAIRTGKYINSSAEAVKEMGKYIRFDNGELGPASLEQDTSGAKRAHGDRVMMDMMLVHGMTHCAAYEVVVAPPPPDPVAQAIVEAMRPRRDDDAAGW